MRIEKLSGKKIDLDACLKFGFIQEKNKLVYRKNIKDLTLVITIVEEEVDASVIDVYGEEYILHHVACAQGHYVGYVREVYEEVICQFIYSCFKENIEYSHKMNEVITFVSDVYGDDLEYLWKNSKNAIWRRKDTQTWYAACLKVSKRKLGLDSDAVCEIINVRVLDNGILDFHSFFPAFHMNKKSWVSILVETTSLEKICTMIQDSYRLTKK